MEEQYSEKFLHDKCIDLGKRLKHIGDVYDIQRVMLSKIIGKMMIGKMNK